MATHLSKPEEDSILIICNVSQSKIYKTNVFVFEPNIEYPSLNLKKEFYSIIFVMDQTVNSSNTSSMREHRVKQEGPHNPVTEFSSISTELLFLTLLKLKV